MFPAAKILPKLSVIDGGETMGRHDIKHKCWRAWLFMNFDYSLPRPGKIQIIVFVGAQSQTLIKNEAAHGKLEREYPNEIMLERRKTAHRRSKMSLCPLLMIVPTSRVMFTFLDALGRRVIHIHGHTARDIKAFANKERRVFSPYRLEHSNQIAK